ncbi:MAG: alkaline phosphatase family protein [Flavobacteriaceae bacterium]
MKKYFFSFLVLSGLILSCQKSKKTNTKPKLVIGIVVDQMRYDYLTKYTDRYGEDGFKRLLNDGFSLTNGHFNYIPTYTAVGHASVYTGTTPDHHGVIGNNWYDKYLKKNIYCVNDFKYTTVGLEGKAGQKSPYRLATTTITDQLHLAQNMRGKTIGIAIKDRSAVIPAGHTANAAYWYEGGKDNKWISSSFYMDKLPSWVTDFNSNNKANEYLSSPWNTLYDINTYTQSTADDNIFEGTFMGEEKPIFPHNLPELRKKGNGGYDIIKSTPFGNTLTLDFAKKAILGEQLGKGSDIDFLAISLSSTDYVGHKYGTNAIETEDTYLRLDKDLADLFQFLDKVVGKGSYTLFLTADHGAVAVPGYLKSLKIPANYFNWKEFYTFLKDTSKAKYGSSDIIEYFSNNQIFLNKEKLKQLKLNEHHVAEYLIGEIINFENVYKAVSAKTLQTTSFTSGVLHKLQKGYNQKLSGDILIVPTPASIGTRKTGTTHGSGYSYDTHIPIIFYGAGIKQGTTAKEYAVTDIAPTLSILLGIEFPNGSTGQVVEEVLE